jgi:hypothetical protein
MSSRLMRNCYLLLLFVTGFMVTGSVLAQATHSGSEPPPLSKFDIYAGYGYIHPFDSQIRNQNFQTVYNINTTVSLTDYFTRHWGVQVEGSYFNGPSQRGIAGQCAFNTGTIGSCSGRDPMYYTAQGGVAYRYQVGRLVPFAHALVGGAKVNGPVYQPLTWGAGLTAGGGFDYILPFFHDLIAVRPIQADFQYMHADYYPENNYNLITTGVADVKAIKLSGGLVLRFGNMTPPPPVLLGCPAQPTSMFPGDPVTVTAQPLNLNPKKKAVYTFTATGGQLTKTDSGATIATAGLAPGDYTVSGHVSEGPRPTQQASCTATFTVKAFEPPTISCSASPSTVMPGTPSTITASGMSPQNRALTYSYAASSGTLTGAGSTATLSTAGVPPGTINVTCNVVDDLGKTATSSTTVTITAPPVAVQPESRNLCSVSFERDRRRPVRVDNEAKACLDDVALTLSHDPSAKLVIVGKYSADEQPVSAEQRTINIEGYLTSKGVDASRIELRLGDGSGRDADDILLPSGAVYSGAATTFDPSSVPAAPAARPVRHRRVVHKKKATS